jgi:LEA14-like dessication related protein
MKKRKIIGIIFLLFIGIIIIGFITGILTIPSIKEISNRWGNISEDTTEIISSITIENNNPFKIIIPRVEVDYTIRMNDIKMAHGKIENINLQKGDTTIEVTSYFDNSKIPEWWISHIKNNEKTIVDIRPMVVIDVEFTEPHIDTPSKTIPINTNLLEDANIFDKKTIEIGPINITMKSVSAEWGNVDNETTELIFNLIIYNPIPLNILMPQIRYNISMNNIIIGNGSITDNLILKANNDSIINLITKIDNNRLDDWFVSHLQNNENSTLKITISSVIEYEGISFKIDDFLIYTYEFDTDILGSAL